MEAGVLKHARAKMEAIGLIIGIGHDLVELDRIQHILEGLTAERFIAKVLTSAERERAVARGGRRIEYVAGRFAAKEAIVKALGCGIGAAVGFLDIEILPDAFGKPVCHLSEGAWQRLGLSSDEVRLHISITHERSLASAYSIAERIESN